MCNYLVILATIFSAAIKLHSQLLITDENYYKQYEELATIASQVFTNLSSTDKNAVILYLEDDITLTKFFDKTSKINSRLTAVTIKLNNYTLSLNDSLGFRPDLTIIFLNKNNYNNVEEVIFNIEIFPVWFVRSKFLLIASDASVEDGDSWIGEGFKQFWDRQARHAVLCFWDKEIKIFTFNPFYSQYSIEVPADADVAGILSEKVRNTNGHKIKLFNMDIVYKDRIVETRVRGKKSYIGMDGIFFSTVASYLSASLEIHNLSSDLDFGEVNAVDKDVPLRDFIETMQGMYDFDALCNAAGVFSDNDDLDHIFQSQRDDLFILTPRAQQIPRYLYLFLLVPGEVWIATGVSFVVTSVVMWGIKTGKRNVFLDNYRLLLLQSITEKIDKFQERMILVAWIIHCIIITTLFQSILMTSFISPKFYPEIDTLEDLYKSGIEIYGASYMIMKALEYVVNEDLRKLLKPINTKISLFGLNNDWLDHFMYKQDCGLLAFLEQETYVSSHPLLHSKYHRMHDAIIPYIRAYWARADRLIFPELVDTMGLMEQAGLNQYWKQFNYGIVTVEAADNVTKMVGEVDEGMKLTVEHLQIGFMVLVGGYVLAGGVFVGEVVVRLVGMVCRKKVYGFLH